LCPNGSAVFEKKNNASVFVHGRGIKQNLKEADKLFRSSEKGTWEE
jgi:hypothetical protein